MLGEQVSFLRFLRLLGEKCPICHGSRMNLMMLCAYHVPHGLENTFIFIISLNVTASMVEEVILLLSEGEVGVG